MFFLFSNDAETSLRLREERLKRNEEIERKVNSMKSKLREQSTSINNNSNLSIIKHFLTKYQRQFYIGLLTIFTGSIFFYKFLASNDRTR